MVSALQLDALISLVLGAQAYTAVLARLDGVEVYVTVLIAVVVVFGVVGTGKTCGGLVGALDNRMSANTLFFCLIVIIKHKASANGQHSSGKKCAVFRNGS